VKLHLLRYAQSFLTLDMKPQAGDIVTGRVYAFGRTLPTGSYAHYFAAEDDDGPATGDPTVAQAGPFVSGPPYLGWTGSDGYVTDAVEPDSASPGSTFRFRVRYWDPDNEAPVGGGVTLEVRDQAGALVRRVPMAAGTGPYRTGRTYRTALKLSSAGEYRYRAVAAGPDGQATGPACRWNAGPKVGDAVTAQHSAAVMQLVALSTSGGAVQITGRLSGSAQVTARILNLAGRPVRRLCQAQPCAAGRMLLLWNAQSDQGTRAPSGTYLVEIVADAPDGTTSRAVTTLRLTR
jgi:hypothetical protein